MTQHGVIPPRFQGAHEGRRPRLVKIFEPTFLLEVTPPPLPTLWLVFRSPLADIGQKLGKKALQEVATIVKPDTILSWHRRLVAQKFKGSS